jgi:hypothetical protein
MRIEEEYFPKRRIKTEMRNILDGRTMSGKVSSGQSPLIDIPKYRKHTMDKSIITISILVQFWI